MKEVISWFILFIFFSFLVSGVVAGGVDKQSLADIEALIDSGDYDETISEANRLLEIYPDDTDLWILLGRSFEKTEQYEIALSALENAIKLNPDSSDAWKVKGDVLYELGRYEEALLAYDKAIELDPDYILAWDNKGCALRNLVRNEEALLAYDKATELDPENSLAWNNKGCALFDLERYEEALLAYEKAIELDPENSLAWNNKGVTLKNLGRTEEANEAFDTACLLKNKDLFEAIPLIICIVLITTIFFFGIYPISRYLEKRKQKKIEKKKAIENEKARVVNKIDKFIEKSDGRQDKPSGEVKPSGTIWEEHSWKYEDLDPEVDQILKESIPHKYLENYDPKSCCDSGIQRVGAHAGICPVCGSPLVWRRARKTDELYRGCTNYNGGCRYNDRSY